jgi:hypothetical protein
VRPSVEPDARNKPLQFRASKILILPAILLALVSLPAIVLAATTPTTTTTTTPTTTTPTTTTTTPTTTTPKPAVVMRWNKAVRIEPAANGGVSAVSCASTALCVAVDQTGHVITTTKPKGGNGSWKPAVKVDGKNTLTGVSCPTTKLCVAIDQQGYVVTSIKPTGGAAAWSKPVKVDAAAATGGGDVGLTGISCPSATLCVVVDGATKGNVLVSTAPTGGAHAWTSKTIGTGPLTSVSCPSVTMCVAAGDQHYVSLDPAAAAASVWKGTGTQLGGGAFSAISCPTTAMCLGVGFGNTSTGLATATSTPHGSATSWKTVDVEAIPPAPGEGLLDAVGCPTASVCVALDGYDNFYTTTTPVGGVWSGSAPIRPDSAANASAIACLTTMCVAVDSAGVETTGLVRG